MIGRLRGTLVAKQPPNLMLEVAGVGYELEAPMSTFYALPKLGDEATLYTHLQVREDAHILYAFNNETDRGLFRSLLKVTGVGAKMALAILSGMDVQSFGRYIQQGDTAALIRLPGIGRKTAERLIIELRDRLGPVGESMPDAGSNQAGGYARGVPEDPVEDALRALVALGYKSPEAGRMLKRIDSADKTSEEIIRLALKTSLK
jgi:Holliday junction DNA helicase RuvA